jgi:hypothetical protein
MKYLLIGLALVIVVLLLARRQKPKPTLVCIRQADARVWPEHLGTKMFGLCPSCHKPICFEAQNAWIERKICFQCSSSQEIT